MANEPERPIEQLLRAAAKKRRDEAGTPLELHPATRRLLQGEVTRQFAEVRPEARPPLPLLVRLWPRFAWAVAIFAVLGVAVWLLLPAPDKANQVALLGRKEATEKALPAVEAARPLPAAQATVIPRPKAAPEASASTLAYSGVAQPASRQFVPQPAAEALPLAKDTFASDTDGSVQAKVPSADTPKLAERERKVAEAEIAASSTTRAPAPGGAANGSLGARYELDATPAPPVRGPATPAPPPPVATAPAAVHVASADNSLNMALDESAPSGRAYGSVAAAASVNRPSPSSAPMPSQTKYPADALKKAQSARVVQQFVQVAPGSETKAGLADKVKAAQPVLASFQVEQADHELWITDGDGSVYKGYLQIGEAIRRSRPAKEEAVSAARAPSVVGGSLKQSGSGTFEFIQPAYQNYSFRVAGTNRSLNKKVVFTGNLIGATNLILPPAATNLVLRARLGVAGDGSVQQGTLPLLNSRITGKVVIGSGKAVEINALPTSP